MNRIIAVIKRNYVQEKPIIRLYFILYLIGVFVGTGAAVLLRNDFSSQAQLLFSPENSSEFIFAWLQQLLCFLLLFILGLTVVGIPLLPLYPLYKGFSMGLLIALAAIFSGVRGFFFGTLAFFAQNALYTVLGYFACYSSARLSITLFELMKGRGKHGTSHKAFIRHIYCFLVLSPLLCIGALWESKAVPIFLSLF